MVSAVSIFFWYKTSRPKLPINRNKLFKATDLLSQSPHLLVALLIVPVANNENLKTLTS